MPVGQCFYDKKVFQKYGMYKLRLQLIQYLMGMIISDAIDHSILQNNQFTVRDSILGSQQLLQCPQIKQLTFVGLLRANWRNSCGELTAYCYGTAFAINKNMLITCTHNIYSQNSKSFCSQMYFIVNLNGKYDQKQHKLYKISAQNIKTRNPWSFNFQEVPTKQELTVIKLEQSLEINHFLQCKSIQLQPIEQVASQNHVCIIGYPNGNFYNKTDLKTINAGKEERYGKINSIDDYIISHSVETSVGFSGGPIISIGSDGKLSIIGIHTHKGRSNNCNLGLFFNQQILQTIEDYSRSLLNNCSSQISSSQFKKRQKQFESQPELKIISNIFQDLSFDISSQIACQKLPKDDQNALSDNSVFIGFYKEDNLSQYSSCRSLQKQAKSQGINNQQSQTEYSSFSS